MRSGRFIRPPKTSEHKANLRPGRFAILVCCTLLLSAFSCQLKAQDHFNNLPEVDASKWTALENLKISDFKKDTLLISSFGAVHDGITLNTISIQKAIDACSDKGGGVVFIPAGLWLTGPIVLKTGVNLHIERGGVLQFTGDFNQYPLVATNYEGLKAARCQAPISAKDQNHIGITGAGIIDGAGDSWRMVKRDKLTTSQWQTLVSSGGVVDKADRIWYPSKGSLLGAGLKKPGVLEAGKSLSDYKNIKDYLRPNLLSLIGCKDILLEGVTFQNSPAWCLHPLLCDNIVIRGIYAKNPWYGQNGDGLDLESCKTVLIENSTFDVGDDGICMKSGRDEQGRKRNVPTSNVLIQFCTVYHAHGGFVIGSEMSGGVNNVAIRHCNFIGTDIGLRFKTTRGRGGIVENIFASGINMQDIKGDAIRFDMYYAAQDPVPLVGESRQQPKKVTVPISEATPRFRNFFIKNIVCNGADHALFFRGLPEMPIQSIYLKNLVMKTRRGIEMTEADGIFIKNMQLVTTQTGVTPLILDNARNLLLSNITAIQEGAKRNTNQTGSMHLQISGKESKNIKLQNSSFNGSKSAVIQYTSDAAKNAVQVN
ncbi:MAG TPA: glycoside hydrolase family 28 protein [Arachidicoccus sp.]|nr:glycoside hydrolase family 28 protein [Arachidicoccus sp.]